MSGLTIALIIIGLIVVGLVAYGISAYNSLVRQRNLVEESWRQVDVELNRRHDLIPNLVETVKGYAKHESGTLESVVQLRNQAASMAGGGGGRGPGRGGGGARPPGAGPAAGAGGPGTRASRCPPRRLPGPAARRRAGTGLGSRNN